MLSKWFHSWMIETILWLAVVAGFLQFLVFLHKIATLLTSPCWRG